MADSTPTPDEIAFLAQDGRKPATVGMLYKLVTKTVLGTIKGVKDSAHERIEALERRVAELEAKPSVSYNGVWGKGQTYQNGDAVTHRVSLWIATLNHLAGEPGQDFVNWQLAVKRGRDARS
jgi:hypothetical protein